jgi:predicted HTH transcriptional regulator
MDICAFANTNGGTIYIGVPADPHKAPIGVAAPKSAMDAIRGAVQKQITPPIEISFATHDTNKVKVLQINVPRGDDPPYAIDENKIYVRNESETVQAVRDEIVDIIRRQTTSGGSGADGAEQAGRSLDRRHNRSSRAQPEAARTHHTAQSRRGGSWTARRAAG